MNTAVIITGQARTFVRCWRTQREAVFRKLENPYFFLSLTNDEAGSGAINAMLAQYGPSSVFGELVEQPEMPEEFRERFEAASIHAPYFRSVPVEAIWKQFWHLARGWEFFMQARTAIAPPIQFDRFFRIRPDLHFHRWTPPYLFRNAGVHVPWWGAWGGCPDRFAYISGVEAANQYFNVFHRINELIYEGCAYHPETMLARAMERAGVRVHHTMDADFTTIRAAGDKRPHDGPSYNNRDLFAYVNARLAEEGR